MTQVALLLALSLIVAVPVVQAADAKPTASFTVSPPAPVTGEQVTFTSTSTDAQGKIASQAWDLDNDGSYDDGAGTTATRTFTAAGNYTIGLRVWDDEGETKTTSKVVTVKVNGAPTAAFSAPTDVDTGQTVTLSSSSTDPDGRPLVEEWDLDGNGTFGDKTGQQVTTSFANDGVKQVSLRVTDSGGLVSTLTKPITVHNRPPTAAFSFSPANPVAGDDVTFTSSSTDPDGTIEQQRWDLDDDGAYDDGESPTAHTTFATAGSYTVALKVTDDDGATGTAFATVNVAARPSPAPPPGGTPPGATGPTGTPAGSPQAALIAPRLLAPFPLVRILGVTTPVGVRLDLLSVRTGGGTRILVLCKGKGKGCPWARKVQNARFSASRTRTIRIPGFRRRYLRAGAVVEVYVTRSGTIGKYTRFRFRKLRPPARVDGCTAAGAARAARCPAR